MYDQDRYHRRSTTSATLNFRKKINHLIPAILLLILSTTNVGIGQDQDLFSEQNVITPQLKTPFLISVADLDGDGDKDVISSSRSNDTVSWFENNGSGDFGKPQTITSNADGLDAIHVSDLDGDGNQDILLAHEGEEFGDDLIIWYKNNGSGEFSRQQAIATGLPNTESLFAADIDGDGNVDVLTALFNGNKIVWYKNNGSGEFGNERLVTDEIESPRSIFAKDLDEDGDIDVLSTSSPSFGDNSIVWYENNGSGDFSSQKVITTEVEDPKSVFAADLDNDGDIDVLSASDASAQSEDGKIAWYSNQSSGFSGQRVITTNVDGAAAVFAADLDGDGNLDAISASSNDDKVAWYENRLDNSNFLDFGDQQVITEEAESAESVFATDLDGDGIQDVISLSRDDDKISWHKNDGAGEFIETIEISASAHLASSVYAIDLDNDGDQDVLSASDGDDKIAWYENDGSGKFSHSVITTDANGAKAVYATDLNGNGNPDVLSASNAGSFDDEDDKIAWYENKDSGEFGDQQVISIDADGPTSIYAADLNGDEDNDVLSASAGDNKIAWYENDGSGGFSDQQVITTDADGASSVFSADLDGDGDTDVLSASFGDDKIAWYENDGSGNFGDQQIITTDARRAQAVYAADLNNNGNIDVLSVSRRDNTVAWYENQGSGEFGEQQAIDNSINNPKSLYAEDLGGDGDIDVLSVAEDVGFDDEDMIIWYENNGSGEFSSRKVISTDVNNPQSVFAVDLNNNGDVDVLSASRDDNKIAWYENQSTTATSISDGATNIPEKFILRQNYPNPFNPSTTIEYGLPAAAEVSLTVYDMLGREVVTLVNQRQSAGTHNVSFDASSLASGVYLYRLEAGDIVQTRKLTLIK